MTEQPKTIRGYKFITAAMKSSNGDVKDDRESPTLLQSEQRWKPAGL
jgi:hypothetical protein